MIFTKNIFTKDQIKAITDAIGKAEKNTSGEIRVHLEGKCKGDVLDRAVEVFSQLKMDKTKLRNGVLIYLAVKDRKFAIIGDSGINTVVPTDFWDAIKEEMQSSFKQEKFVEGVCQAISMAGESLQKHFPHNKGDINELPNEVSLG